MTLRLLIQNLPTSLNIFTVANLITLFSFSVYCRFSVSNPSSLCCHYNRKLGLTASGWASSLNTDLCRLFAVRSLQQLTNHETITNKKNFIKIVCVTREIKRITEAFSSFTIQLFLFSAFHPKQKKEKTFSWPNENISTEVLSSIKEKRRKGENMCDHFSSCFGSLVFWSRLCVRPSFHSTHSHTPE